MRAPCFAADAAATGLVGPLSACVLTGLWCRKGLYPIRAFPQPLGTEAAGEIVALPTDEAVLADEEYKLRGFAVGVNVAVVRVSRRERSPTR